MQLRRASVDPATGRSPVGLSFELADLLLLQAWADFHDLRMVVDLDACVDGVPFEERLRFYDRGRAGCRWMMWRAGHDIVVQPASGRGMVFEFVADALEILIPAMD